MSEPLTPEQEAEARRAVSAFVVHGDGPEAVFYMQGILAAALATIDALRPDARRWRAVRPLIRCALQPDREWCLTFERTVVFSEGLSANQAADRLADEQEARDG